MFRQRLECLSHVCCIRRDEQWMIEPASDERHLDIVAIASQLGACGSNVLAILLATRIRMLRRRDEAYRSTQTRGAQIAQRIRKERVPVAHPDVHRKWMTRRCQAILQARRLMTSDGCDWRHAAEELVVASDLFDTLRADAPAAENIREKRADVIEPLRSTE